ncbi:MAG: DUF1934 domain-containing protein [Erysipelotrichaceae bacterium]|nr:DUF1934 domain-containing protein [Erysipelotrichaceae bacterium]
MEIRIVATSYDLINNEEFLIKDGVAHLFDDKHLTYLEDNTNVRNEIVWNDDEIILSRLGQPSSVNNLKLNEFSICSVDTVYGEMVLDSYLVDKKRDLDNWYVEYKLFNQGEIVAHLKIIWRIKGVNNESN